MTGEDLIEEISFIIRDNSFTPEWIESKLNEGMRAIQSRVFLPGLADGYAVLSTELSTNQIDLPDDFHSEIYSCRVDGNDTRILSKMAAGEVRAHLFPFEVAEGDIVAVAAQGTKLLYYLVPKVVTDIAIKYYRKAALITDSSDELDGYAGYYDCEEPLRKGLMAHVCRVAFNRLEDGFEAVKVNTTAHNQDFEVAVAELTSLAAVHRPVHTYRRESTWE